MASKLAFCGGALFLAVCLAGCANTYTVPLKPPSGSLLTTQTLPLTVDMPPEGLPVGGLRKITVESGYLFWPYPAFDLAWGDLRALGKTVRSERLMSVSYAEVEVLTVLSLFGRYTVNVYGTPAFE